MLRPDTTYVTVTMKCDHEQVIIHTSLQMYSAVLSMLSLVEGQCRNILIIHVASHRPSGL